MAEWLTWTVNEFSLKNVDFDKFCMNGAALCAMGKDRFLDLAPDFVGDILWEHLEMLQKGKAFIWRHFISRTAACEKKLTPLRVISLLAPMQHTVGIC